MKKFIFLFLFHSICFASSLQLITVHVNSPGSNTGELQRYSRSDSSHKFQPVGKTIHVIIGKNGLSNNKKEGDNRTPIGTYSIGPIFGFADNSNYKMDYFPLNENSVCVDDVKSIYYNQLIDSKNVAKKDWHSGEAMREIPQYKIGAVIKYNSSPIEKDQGSCIFLHVWKKSDSGTAGCIAMDEKDLTEVLHWLDKRKKPVIRIEG